MNVQRFLTLAGSVTVTVFLLNVSRCALAAELASPPLDQAVFVTNLGGNYVTIYDLKSNGDTAPLANIDGTTVSRAFDSVIRGGSGLDDPLGVALDLAGNIYVGNMSGGANYTGAIDVFQAGAHGRATPIAKIDGPDTGLYTVKSIAVDSKGNIYATRQAYLYDRSAPGINVYPAGSTGNVKPIAIISGPSTGIDNLEGIAVDTKGSIYVTNNAGSGSILVFPAGSSGDVRPTAVIGPSKTNAVGALALDSRANVYVARLSGSERSRRQTIEIYRAGSSSADPPIATISGPKTGLADPNYTIRGIAVDSNGNIYAVSGGGGRGQPDKVIVYTSGRDGDVGPRATIEGPHTRLSGAQGIAIGRFAYP
jgi:sugar lactone lactonase YvrE